jgi:hypothetical protein
MEKGQAETRPGLLSEIAHNKIAAQRIYFPPFGVGGTTTSLCCAQAPSPNAVTKTAITTIIFKNFNLISPPFAAGCSGLFRQGTSGKQCFS